MSRGKKFLLGYAILAVFSALLVIAITSSDKGQTSPESSAQTNQSVAQPAGPARPATPVPHFKVAHEDYQNPIPLVIAKDATDEQVVSLLWKVRDDVRSHSFTNLGLQPANSMNRYNTSGMIEVFRGTKCVAETYTEGVWPCGDEEHYDGFYQWGLGGQPLDALARFAKDDGGYRKIDGTIVKIFSENDGYTLPAALQQKVDSEARDASANEAANKAERETFASNLEERLIQAGFHINIVAGGDNNLIMVSDIFEQDSGRVSFLSTVLPKWKSGLCKIGFTTVTLKSGMLSLGDDYRIGC
jgi:hypothetical protein